LFDFIDDLLKRSREFGKLPNGPMSGAARRRKPAVKLVIKSLTDDRIFGRFELAAKPKSSLRNSDSGGGSVLTVWCRLQL